MAGSNQLVKVATTGPALDGIVFDTPNSLKVVVAVMDPARGPVFRTFSSQAVSERTEAGPDDQALHLLIRRTPAPVPTSGRGAGSAVQGRSGFKRGAAHRATGR
jgi:hypothetical protein